MEVNVKAAIAELSLLDERHDRTEPLTIGDMHRILTAMLPKTPGIPGKQELYQCKSCGKSMTKAEGGTVFTHCEACWDKEHGCVYPAMGTYIDCPIHGQHAEFPGNECVCHKQEGAQKDCPVHREAFGAPMPNNWGGQLASNESQSLFEQGKRQAVLELKETFENLMYTFPHSSQKDMKEFRLKLFRGYP